MVWEFLQEVSHLDSLTLNKITVIMGKDTCDLDSAVSSIVYAYIQNCVAQGDPRMGKAIPVMNIKREDFELKTEVLYFLKKCGVPLQDLLFRDTFDLNFLHSWGTLELILVNHHFLSEDDIHLTPNVREVVDHQPLDPQWVWENVDKKIEVVGSCATLIAEMAIKKCVFPIPQEILYLLYGTIIMETSCLSDNPKKYTTKDMEIVQCLEQLLVEIPDAATVYMELLYAQKDISKLTVSQILKKDMKIVCDIPICIVPLLIKDFLGLSGAEIELHHFVSSFQHKAVIILGIVSLQGNCWRELAVYAENANVLELLTNALMSNKFPDLGLEDIRGYDNLQSLKVFYQQNTQVSREQIILIVKEAVTSWITSHKFSN